MKRKEGPGLAGAGRDHKIYKTVDKLASATAQHLSQSLNDQAQIQAKVQDTVLANIEGLLKAAISTAQMVFSEGREEIQVAADQAKSQQLCIVEQFLTKMQAYNYMKPICDDARVPHKEGEKIKWEGMVGNQLAGGLLNFSVHNVLEIIIRHTKLTKRSAAWCKEQCAKEQQLAAKEYRTVEEKKEGHPNPNCVQSGTFEPGSICLLGSNFGVKGDGGIGRDSKNISVKYQFNKFCTMVGRGKGRDLRREDTPVSLKDGGCLLFH
jgi:hypothetical protein